MDSSTPSTSFQPINLQDSPIIQRLDPWQLIRIMERETDRLLTECFPGWATHGDPALRDEWRLLCQELILQSGTVICDAFRALHPQGTAEILTHTGTMGLYLIIDMQDGEYRRQVYLVTTVLYELRRTRRMGIDESGRSFSFLNTLRAAYDVPADAPHRAPSSLPGEFASFFVRSWRPDLVSDIIASAKRHDPFPQPGE